MRSIRRTAPRKTLPVMAIWLVACLGQAACSETESAKVEQWAEECRSTLAPFAGSGKARGPEAFGTPGFAIDMAGKSFNFIGWDWLGRREDIRMIVRYSDQGRDLYTCQVFDEAGFVTARLYKDHLRTSIFAIERSTENGMPTWSVRKPGKEGKDTRRGYRLFPGDNPGEIMRYQIAGVDAGTTRVEALYSFDLDRKVMELELIPSEKITISASGRRLFRQSRPCYDRTMPCTYEYSPTRYHHDENGNVIRREYTSDGRRFDERYEIETNDRGDWISLLSTDNPGGSPTRRYIEYRD